MGGGGLPLITYASRRRGGGVKPPIHFYCILHAKTKGVKIACKIGYVINGKPHRENAKQKHKHSQGDSNRDKYADCSPPDSGLFTTHFSAPSTSYLDHQWIMTLSV